LVHLLVFMHGSRSKIKKQGGGGGEKQKLPPSTLFSLVSTLQRQRHMSRYYLCRFRMVGTPMQKLCKKISPHVWHILHDHLIILTNYSPHKLNDMWPHECACLPHTFLFQGPAHKSSNDPQPSCDMLAVGMAAPPLCWYKPVLLSLLSPQCCVAFHDSLQVK
jgi:hypothetical protein